MQIKKNCIFILNLLELQVFLYFHHLNNFIFIQSISQATVDGVSLRKLEVQLTDTNPEAFQLLLLYIYTDEIMPLKES